MPGREIWLLVDSRGFGGIESHLAELAAGLREAGEAPRLLFLQDHGPHPLRARLDAQGLPWEALPPPGRAGGGFAGLLRALRRRRPGLLHTHGYKANLLGRLAARLAGVPVVASFHAGEPPLGRLRLYDLADRWSSFLGGRIAVSGPIAARLPFRTPVIPNFVALPPPPPPGTVPPLVVGFVGRLAAEKGPDLFCALAEAAPGPRYEAFGDGPMRAACEMQAAGRIRFHGSRDGMAGAWGGIGLLAITSRAEGLPLAALEAMAHGVPVAGFALGGLPELISDGRNGFLVPPGDVAALAACVRHWAAMDGAARAALGEAARARIAEGYERTAGTARIRAAYAEAMATRRPWG